MKEEKMLILSMLEEGKITSDEAIKLLEAIDGKRDSYSQEDNKSKSHNNNNEDKSVFKDIFNNLENIGTDLGNALFEVVDELKEFTNSFDFEHSSESITSNLDIDLDTMKNPSLDLRAINGDINLIATNEDILSIKVTCRYKKGLLITNEQCFNFINTNETIILSPKYKNNISIKLDILLPDRFYSEIKLNTTNGKIILRDIKSKNISCKTSNSIIDVSSIDSQAINLVTSNGKIILNDINTSNTNNITLTNSNGWIISEMFNFNKEIIFDLETYIGNIHLDLPNLIYKTNQQVNLGLKKIVAHSSNYDLNKDHLAFVASTSNGSIKIN